MKSKKWITCLALVLMAIPAWQVQAADRSPFEEPLAPETLYNYKIASHRIMITGLITTDTDGKVIIQTSPEGTASVFSVGSRIVVPFNGVDHEYRIKTIKTRSLILRALNGKTYEVEAN